MKTPITYYGGKQGMLKDILPRLYPDRTLYCEPFFGGGAVFFGKEQEKHEVVNDKLSMVVNFYQVVKDADKLEHLAKMADASLYSEALFNRARLVWEMQCAYTDIERAWAFWYLSKLSFGGRFRTLSVCVERSTNAVKLDNAKKALRDVAGRFDTTDISMDACDLISRFDYDKAFFYCDPPYVGANQGHYSGYRQCDFDDLIDTLASIKGHFLLSSYDNPSLDDAVKKHGWQQVHIENVCNTSGRHKATERRRKIEVLTANYAI